MAAAMTTLARREETLDLLDPTAIPLALVCQLAQEMVEDKARGTELPVQGALLFRIGIEPEAKALVNEYAIHYSANVLFLAGFN